MYEKHFGLERRVFRGNPAAADVFVGPQTAAILAGVKKALNGPDAVVAAYGPVGVGKTTAVAHALSTISGKNAIVRIGRIQLGPGEILDILFDHLRVKNVPAKQNKKLALFRQLLHNLAVNSARVFVLVEDAPRLGSEVLSELEIATAADTGPSDGANIILMGDESLRALLANPELARLNQRTRLRHAIDPLSVDEMRGYLRHCFRQAGGDFDRIFDSRSAEMLHTLSGGVARIANNIAESIMTAAAEEKADRIDVDLVNRIAMDEYGLEPAEIPPESESVPPAAPQIDESSQASEQPRSAKGPEAIEESGVDIEPESAQATTAPEESSPVEDSSLVDHADVAEDVRQVDESAILEDVQATEEPQESDQSPILEEVQATEEHQEIDQPPALEEVQATEEPAEIDLSVALEEVQVAKEPRKADESPAPDEVHATEEEPSATAEPQATGEHQATEDPQEVDQSVTLEEVQVDDEPQKTDESPVVEKVEATETPREVDRSPTLEEVQAAEAPKELDESPMTAKAEAIEAPQEVDRPSVSEDAQAADDNTPTADEPQAFDILQSIDIEAETAQETKPEDDPASEQPTLPDPAEPSIADDAETSPSAVEKSTDYDDIPHLIQDTQPLPVLPAELAQSHDTLPNLAILTPELTASFKDDEDEDDNEPLIDDDDLTMPALALQDLDIPAQEGFTGGDTPVAPPAPESVAPVTRPATEPVAPEADKAEEEEELAAWDREPTIAELRPDLEALERAMAIAQGRSPDGDDDETQSDAAEDKTSESAIDDVPEITLDDSIRRKIEAAKLEQKQKQEAAQQAAEESKSKKNSLSNASPSASDSADKPVPDKGASKSNPDLQKIADSLAQAKTIEDVDDCMAETLFGEELSQIAAEVVANRPSNPKSDSEANAKTNGKSEDDIPELKLEEEPKGKTSAQAEAKSSSDEEFENVWGAIPDSEALIDTESDTPAAADTAANPVTSISQRLATVRALNAGSKPEAAVKPPANGAAAKPKPRPKPKPPENVAIPETVEEESTTSISQTLKALNEKSVPKDDGDDDNSGQKGGFFSRFRRS